MVPETETDLERKMPPEVSYCRSIIVMPQIRYSIPLNKHSPKTKNMSVTKKRLVLFFLLILSTISIFRLLLITVTTYSSSLPPLLALQATQAPSNSNLLGVYPNLTAVTVKEFQLLLNLIAQRAPCNLLVFGLEPEYLSLSSINHKGNTVFLEDNDNKMPNVTLINPETTRIHKVKYDIPAKEAYGLLRHARKNRACANFSEKCRLALRDLPREVYELEWDVVVIDGPSGDSMDAPGRMGVIYTVASMAVARRDGGFTEIVVHDVDRTIERWFSWEFLRDENLVSAKGKLWSFRIRGRMNSTEFFPLKSVVIV